MNNIRFAIWTVVCTSLWSCTAIDGYADDKKAAADMMKDPSSAQFRNLRRKSDAYSTVCGEINAKNSMGGYVGFVPFEVYTDAEKRRIVRIHTTPKTDPSNPFKVDIDAISTNSSIDGDCAF